MKEDGNLRKKINANNYFKAGTLYLVGNFFNRGIGFLTIPIFTRILSTYEYGIVNTYTSWVSIFVSVLGLSLQMGIRVGFTDHEEFIDEFLSTINTFTLFFSIALSMIIFLILNVLDLDLGMGNILIIFALLQASSQAIKNNYEEYLKFKIEYTEKTILQVLPGLLTIIISIPIILFMNTNRYYGKTITNALLLIIFACIVLIRTYKKKRTFNKEYLKIAIPVSIPIIAHSMSLTILSQSDRVMLTSLVGPSATGIYSLIYNISMAVSVIAYSLDSVWVPWFTTNLKKQHIKQINERATTYLSVMTLPIIILIMFSPEILMIISPEEYWEATTTIPLIVLASYIIFIYTLYVNVEHYYKKTKSIAFNTITAAVINIILNYFLIQLYSYNGAALATVFSYIIAFIMHYRNARKLENTIFPISILVIPILIIISNIFLYYLVLDLFVLRITFVVIQSIIYFFLYFQDFKSMITKN